MDMSISPVDDAFRQDVRAFLAEALTPDLRAASAASTGSFCDLGTTLAWHRALYRKGWVAPNWPVEHGGTGWTATQRYIFAAECARAQAPAPLTFGLQMCGPVLMHYGTAAQKAAYLPAILSGEHRWCQGYSEPGSGSDLASLQTRAHLDDGHYIVNGTKIWTTFAHNATHIFCLVRTQAEGKPQAGISFLLIDLSTPGITMRPIVNIAGDHEFNQLFFDEVRVPDTQRVGPENGGWAVAKYLLEFERGSSYGAGLRAKCEALRTLARGLDTSPAQVMRLSQAEIDVTAVEINERRVISNLVAGDSPGVFASTLKLQGSELHQRLDELAIEIVGDNVALAEPPGAVAMGRYLYDRSMTIYGGTSEIQRNIVARAGLGL